MIPQINMEHVLSIGSLGDVDSIAGYTESALYLVEAQETTQWLSRYWGQHCNSN